MNNRLSQTAFETAVFKISQLENDEIKVNYTKQLDSYIQSETEDIDGEFKALDEGLQLIVSESLKAEALQEEISKMSPEELLQMRLQDPEVIANLIQAAEFLHQRTKGNWFDMAYMIKKTGWKTVKECLQILNMLKLSGRLLAKMDRGEKYKIVLTAADKIATLEAQKVLLQTQIDNIDKDIARIREEEEKKSLTLVEQPKEEENVVVAEEHVR